MKFYFSYFKLRFITSLQYKAAALAGLSTQFFFGLVMVMVYTAFYEQGNIKDAMSISELMSYVWLSQSFFSLVYMAYGDREIYDLITSGNISYELVRPQNIYFMWFSKIIAQRLSNVTLRFLPVIIVSLLLPYPYGLSLPFSFLNFILFLITLIIGTLLMTSIITMFHVISLTTLSEKGIVSICSATADIFSGLVVPIPFFPIFMKKIANILPFRYVSDLPFRIYSNNISLSLGLKGLFIQIVWIVILILAGYILTNKNLKRVVVQGG